MIFSNFSNNIEKSYLLSKKEMILELQKENIDKEIIDLSIAEPDLDPPKQLLESFERNLRDKKNNTYPPGLGFDELRNRLSEWARKDYGCSVSIENIGVTCGARGGLATVMQILLNPGDEVIVMAPHWSGYPNQIKLFGGIPKIIQLDEEESFYPTIEQLENASSLRTKILILNNPHNPTGIVWEKNTLIEILTWAEKKNIFVLADEVCCVEIFDNILFHPIAKLRGSFNNLAVVRSFSKNLAIPGWRVGWVIASPELIEKIGAVQGCTTGGVHSTTQHALIESWQHIEPWLEKNILVHQERRDTLYQELSKLHGFRTIKPQAGITAFSNIQYYLGNKIGGKVPNTSEEFVDIVFNKTGVLLSSGKSLGLEGFVRFSFTKDNSELKKAVQNISSILEQ